MYEDTVALKNIRKQLKDYKSFVRRLENLLQLKKITKQEYDLKIYSKFGTLRYKEKIKNLETKLKNSRKKISPKEIVPIIASIVLVLLIAMTLYKGLKPNAYVIYNLTNSSQSLNKTASQISQPSKANTTSSQSPVAQINNTEQNRVHNISLPKQTQKSQTKHKKSNQTGTAQINRISSTNNTTLNNKDNLMTNTTKTKNITSTNKTSNTTINQTINITTKINITQNKTRVNKTQNSTKKKINKTENITINQTENITINQTTNITTNITKNITINQTSNITINKTKNKTENITEINKTQSTTTNHTQNLTNRSINKTTNTTQNKTEKISTNTTKTKNITSTNKTSNTTINQTINITKNITKTNITQNKTINYTQNVTNISINRTINQTENITNSTINKTKINKNISITRINLNRIKNAFSNTIISPDTKISVPFKLNITNTSKISSNQISILGSNISSLLSSVSSIRLMYNNTLLVLIKLNKTSNSQGSERGSIVTGFASYSQDRSSQSLISKMFSSVYSFFAQIIGSMRNFITGYSVSNYNLKNKETKISYSLAYLNNETVPKISIIPTPNKLELNITINTTIYNNSKKYQLNFDLNPPKTNASLTKGKTNDNLTIEIDNTNNQEYSNIAFSLPLTKVLGKEAQIIKSINETKLIKTNVANKTKISYSISNQFSQSDNTLGNSKVMFIQLSNLTTGKTSLIFTIPKNQVTIKRKILQDNSEEIQITFANKTSQKNISLKINKNTTADLKNLTDNIIFTCGKTPLNTTTNTTSVTIKMDYSTGKNPLPCRQITISLPKLNSSIITSYIITANKISKEFSVRNSKATIYPKSTKIVTNCDNCKYKCMTDPKNLCISNNQSSNKWMFVGDLTYNLNRTNDSNYSVAYLCLNENYNQETKATPINVQLIGSNLNCSENISFVKDYTKIGSFIAYHKGNYCIPLNTEELNKYISENNSTQINLRLTSEIKNNIVCFKNSKSKINPRIDEILADPNITISEPTIGLVK